EHEHDDRPGPHGAPLTDVQLRVRALESLLMDKGLVDPKALDALIDTYETRVGPRNGARVVAKAWVDPAFRQRLLADSTAAIAELGYIGRQGEDMVVLENTPKVHNVVVCTLCSCYPWPVLGLPPVWYKSGPYRARTVIDPRGVLREFGVDLADDVGARCARGVGRPGELPALRAPRGARRHRGNDGRAARRAGDPRLDDRRRPGQASGMNGIHDLGGMHGFGPVDPEPNEPVFHHEWERRAFALNLASGFLGRWNIDMGRYAREHMPPAEYLATTYYQHWLYRLQRLLLHKGLVAAA